MGCGLSDRTLWLAAEVNRARWKAISNQLDCRVETVLRVAQEGQKKGSTIPLKVGPVSPVISTSVAVV
jgi:hypothetical protein